MTKAEELYKEAEELYKESFLRKKRTRYDGWRTAEGELGIRAVCSLIRAGYGVSQYDWRKPKSNRVDREKVKNAVLDGSIWEVRNIGPFTVMQICQWLVATEREPNET